MSNEKKKLGEMLIEKGLIDEMQLQSAIGRQKQWGGRFGSNLVKLGYISEITLLKFLGSQLKLPCADLSKIVFSKNVLALVPRDVARQFHIIPVDMKESGGKKVIFLAMSEPTNMLAIDEVAFLTGTPTKPVIATDSQIESALQKYYENKGYVRIEPLKEKVPVIDQDKLEIIHEVPLKEKKTIQQKKQAADLLALIRILVKKGVITHQEYEDELTELNKLREML